MRSTFTNRQFLPIVLIALALLLGAHTRAAGPQATGYTYDAVGNLIGVSGIDLTSDPANCGRAENRCPDVANGAGTCTNGVCSLICNPGYYSCKSDCLTRTDAILKGCSTAAGDAAWLIPILSLLQED